MSQNANHVSIHVATDPDAAAQGEEQTVTGYAPRVVFVLRDGTELVVTHYGDALRVSNNGINARGRVVVLPESTNAVRVEAR